MLENNPIQAVPEIQPATTSNIQQPKTNNFLIVLLSILLVISVSISGFFAYQTQKLVRELQENKEMKKVVEATEPTVEPVATESSEVDVTANWKAYSNSKYNFSFKYPEDWKVTLSPVDSGKFNLTADKANSTNETGFVPVQFSINMSTSDNKITTLSQAETIYKISNNQSRKDILIDNKPAVTITGLVEGPGPGTGSFLSYTFVELDDEILVIQLGNKDYSTILNQILSTFKFIN